MNAIGLCPRVSALIVVAMLGSAGAGAVNAESPLIRWERIEGIVPSAAGQTLSGIFPVSFPWSTTRGNATLNVDTGNLQFHVEGLSMGSSPTPARSNDEIRLRRENRSW